LDDAVLGSLPLPCASHIKIALHGSSSLMRVGVEVDIGDLPYETLAGSWLRLRFGVFLDRGFIYLSVKIDRRDLGIIFFVRKK
jgi:hypothetical protein